MDLPGEAVNIAGFRIIRELSRGVMASVYLAIQENLEREVVLKVMARNLLEDPALKEAFVNEGKIVARLNHPHIITIYDLGCAQEGCYISMEYISGKNLQERIQEGLTLGESLQIMVRAARALDYAHRCGIVHRNIKPANILFRENEYPVLTDFTIAQPQGEGVSHSRDSIFIGTPGYFSPERVKGEREDARSDLYSLGAVCYEMLTGNPPYVGVDAFATALKHARHPVPELPEPLAFFQPILNRLMAKETSHRFGDAQEFIEALEPIVRDRMEGGAALFPKPTQGPIPRSPSSEETSEEIHSEPIAQTSGEGAIRQRWLLNRIGWLGPGIVVAGMAAVVGWYYWQQPGRDLQPEALRGLAQIAERSEQRAQEAPHQGDVKGSLALMEQGPQVDPQPEGQAVLIIDNSGSMRKSDPQSLTKQAVAQFIQNASLDTQVALLIFDKEVEILARLTPLDENARLDLLTHLNHINFKGALSNSGDALALAIEELQDHGQPAAEKYIVFLTDGIVDTGDVARDLYMAERMRGELAARAAGAGIRIFAIAFTDNADRELMEDLAKATAGAYFQPMSPEDLPGVFAQINASLAAAHAPPGTGPQAKAPVEGPEEPLAVPEISTATEASQPPPKGMPAAQSPEQPSNWINLVAISTVAMALLLVGASLVLMYRMSAASKQRQNRLSIAPSDAPQALLYLASRKKLPHSAQTDVYDLTGKATLIGRAPGSGGIVISDPGISRQHAVIEYRDYTYWVIDQGSANGTFVNDERIEGVRRLNHGDRLRLHKTECLFLMPGRHMAEKTVIAAVEGMLSQATKGEVNP